MVFGEAMALASLAASAFGKKKDKPATSESGFAAMPPEVQRIFLETYLPGAQKQFEKPYQAPPMKRVNRPSSIFDSQGLYDLQQYSDAAGGLFTPLSKQPGASAKPSATPVDPEVMKKYGMTLAELIASRPDVLSALGGGNKQFSQAYGTGSPTSNAAINWWGDWGSKGY